MFESQVLVIKFIFFHKLSRYFTMLNNTLPLLFLMIKENWLTFLLFCFSANVPLLIIFLPVDKNWHQMCKTLTSSVPAVLTVVVGITTQGFS